jgi:uncharacterized membrane-anchored protein
MFGSCNYLHAGITAFIAVDNYLDVIDTIVVLWKLRNFFLCVPLDGFGYVDMLTTNSKKQNSSP